MTKRAAAISAGALPEVRLIQYKKLKKEARCGDDPSTYICRRAEERRKINRAKRK